LEKISNLQSAFDNFNASKACRQMLHKTTKVRGYHVHAADGVVGHVDDCLFDEKSWAIRYLVVDTSNWIGGRSVLVSPDVVTAIDSESRRVTVSLTRAQIKESPSIDLADIAVAETLPSIWIM
jgi:hypothetical protein